MKLEGSQKSAIGPYPEPVQPSPEPHMPFLEDLFSIRYRPVIIIPITFSTIAMNKRKVSLCITKRWEECSYTSTHSL